MKKKPIDWIQCYVPQQNLPIIISTEVIEKLIVEKDPERLIATYVLLLYEQQANQEYRKVRVRYANWPRMDQYIKRLEEIGLLEVVK